MRKKRYAIQARATNDRRAYAVHLPLLLYLACVAAAVGLFASHIHGLMQPTVIPNIGLAGYKGPGPEYLFRNKPGLSAEERERAAIAVAEAENRDQGIEPLLAFATAEATSATLRESHLDTPTVRPAKQAKPKPKRVARQHTVAAPWRSAWNSSWHSWEQERRWNGGAGPTNGRQVWSFGNGF